MQAGEVRAGWVIDYSLSNIKTTERNASVMQVVCYDANPLLRAAMVTTVTAEQLGIQGLGWIVRRGYKIPPEMVPFYQAAWGLNAPRPPGPSGAVMLWGGDLTMFEVSTLTPGASTPSRAGEMSVVMATSDFPTSLRRKLDAGASQVREKKEPLRRAMLTDPEGRLLGLLETEELVVGRTAAAVTLPDVPPLPPDLGGICRVSVRVEDPVALAAFYQRTLGLEPQGAVSDSGAQLSLGRGVVLELQPGGHRYDAPTDRKEVPDVWILRIADNDALAARLKSMDVQIINHVEIGGGVLTYAVDPEGHLFGMQQRTPDLLPPDRAERVEDRAARAAWTAFQS